MIVFIVIFLSIFLAPERVKAAVSLTISDPVVTDTSLAITASMSGASSNYYLQGTLRAVDSSKYFGETKNNRGEWVDYVSSPEKEFVMTNFFATDVKEASWSGKIEIRFKIDDTNYKGPSNYEIKLRRFTGGSSSAAGESNILIVTLTTPLPVPSPSPSPLPSPSPSPSPTPSPTPAPSPKPIPSVLLPSPSLVVTKTEEGTVAGVTNIDLSAFGLSPSPSALESPKPQLKLNQGRAKIVTTIGSGLSIVAVAGYLFLLVKHKL